VIRALHRGLRGALVACVALATALGTGAPRASAASLHAWTQPDTLRLQISASPHTLNPILNTQQEDAWLGSLAFDLLVTADGRGDLVPQLAAEVPTVRNGGISRDGLTIAYKLRRGVRWHDGAPFTSADVAFTYRAIMDPRTNMESRVGYERVARVETPDRYTVVFHLKEKWAPFVRTVFSEAASTFRILPEHLLGRVADINRADFNDHPIGTGPYKFVRWQRGDRIEYVANDDYFGGKPHIRNVVVREIPDGTTAGILAQRHELDLLFTDSSTFAAHRNDPDLRAELLPENAYAAYELNTSRPPFDDARVRRAVAAAIDRESLVRKNTFGTGVLAYADIPPRFWTTAPPRDPNRYDPAAASRVLDAAGWRRGPDGMRAKDGRRLQVELTEYAGSATLRNEDVQVQAELRAVGIDAAIRTYALATYYGPADAGGILKGGKFDLAAYGWLSGIDLDDSALYTCAQRAPSGNNSSRYCSPEMEAAQRAALSTYDDTARRSAYARIEALLARDVPELFLYYVQRRTLANPDLRRPTGNFVELWWNVGAWSFEGGR
jgi:peptide/nickel transport system substrate-binding protein